MLYDEYVKDTDWKALVVHKQNYNASPEWAEQAAKLLKNLTDSNAYAIMLYDAITLELIKIEDRIQHEQRDELAAVRSNFRQRTYNS